MPSVADLLIRARNRSPLKFREFLLLIDAAGFVENRSGGSHRVFKHPRAPGHINVQPKGREAKPYQVKQFIAMIHENDIDPAGAA